MAAQYADTHADNNDDNDDSELLREMDALPADTQSPPRRSPYHLPTSERLRGVANRIIFSRYYIIFYLAMTGLSLGTVILSLLEGGCPSTTWHILEIIVNGGMVLEVGTRWVGFGKQYPLTPLNVLDLFLTAFCIITLLLVFLNPCGASSKRKSPPHSHPAKLTLFQLAGEEVLDTILLVVRNAVQFWRLGTILKRSGHSLFHPPKPIDLSQARSAAFDLDLDLDDDEALAAHHIRNEGSGAAAGGYQELSTTTNPADKGRAGHAFFDAAEEVETGRSSVELQQQSQASRVGVFGDGQGQVGYEAGRQDLTADQEDQWDRLT